MPPRKISVVGGLNMDLVFQTERMPAIGESMDGTALEYYPGGKGANTAVAAYRASHENPLILSRQNRHSTPSDLTSGAHSESNSPSTRSRDRDIRVFMNGAVGDDEYGLRLKQKLSVMGINVSGIETFPGEPSGTCVVFVEKDSGESRNLAYQGANLKWTWSHGASIEQLAAGQRPDLVIAHLGVRRDQVERILEVAAQEGVETLLNPSPAVYLISATYRNVTHLVMNEPEAAMLSGRALESFNDEETWKEAAADFIEMGVKNVVLTLGEKGAYFATWHGVSGIIEAEKDVQVADTTGAGDTFVGMYAVEYIRQKQQGQWDIAKAVRRACKASARTIERFGAQESIPWANEVDA
ncbi:Ribokinase-like protein [Aspergillus terricola var. indicus]